MLPDSLLPFVDILGKSLLLLALAFLVLGLLRGSASRRHCVWLAVFGALFLLPLTKLAPPLWTLSFEKPKPPIAVRLESARMALSVPAAAGAMPAPLVAKWQYPAWPEVVIFIWGCGVLLLLGYRLPGSFQLNRLLRQSGAAQFRLAETAARVAGEFSVRAEVRVSRESRVPMTWGTLRPVVLLPTDAEHWSDGRLMAALRHEFAHIARNDFLNRGLAQIACALYWPNPLVWLAARHWRLEQEMACDDAVLQHGAPAADYAEQLVEVARNFIRPVLGQRRTLAMAQPCTLEARVKAVLDGRRDRSSAGRGIRMVLSTVLIAALAASALAQTGVAKSNAGNANGAVFVLSDTASMAKAKKIIIPKFEVKDVSLTKAVDFLRQLSTKFDSEPDPRRRGVNIFIKLSPGAAELPNVTVKLENVSLADALKQIARLGGLELTANDQALALVPAGSIPKLSDTVYVVPTGMRLLFKGKDEAALKQMFESAGISFGQGASVTFEEPDTLSVRNTDEARRLISSILQRNLATALQTHSPTPQSIEARASEIRLPKVTFRGATLPDALDILRKMAVEADPEKKGVAILLQPAAEQHAADYRVTLQLVDIPLLEAVKYVAVAGDVAARVSGQGIVIETAQDASRLVTREYKVDKGFLATAKDDAALQKFFADNGVAFPPNATLWKTPRGFAMRNTEAQHAILAGMLEDPASQQSGVADDAKAARGKTDLQAISVQLETYRKITGAYPTTAQGLKALWEKPADLPTGAKWVQLMASEPGDPFGRTYQYRRSADGKSYEVFGLGPDGVESADDVR